MQGLYMVSGVGCNFTEWHFPALDQAGEVDTGFLLIIIRKVNFLQVYNKLAVFRTLYNFQDFLPFCVTTRPVLRSSQSTQWKVQHSRSVSRMFCISKLFY